jgi:hypothetical protein
MEVGEGERPKRPVKPKRPAKPKRPVLFQLPQDWDDLSEEQQNKIADGTLDAIEQG